MKISGLFILVFFSVHLSAQDISLRASVDIPAPDLFASDNTGNIYLTDNRGNLYKYSRLLDNLLVYSPDKPSRITHLDPWMGLRILIFYKDIQEFTLVNRFLDAPANYTIQSTEIGFVLAAALSFDNKLWVIDQPSMSLYKYDYQNQQVESRRPLDRILKRPLLEILVFREYQNRIYIIDKAGGVYVFDNLGNFLFEKSLPVVNGVRFLGNELYYYSEGDLVFFDLYTFKKSRESMPVPAISDIRNVIYSEEGLYILSEQNMHLYDRRK